MTFQTRGCTNASTCDEINTAVKEQVSEFGSASDCYFCNKDLCNASLKIEANGFMAILIFLVVAFFEMIISWLKFKD